MKLLAVLALSVFSSINAFADVNPQAITCAGTLASGTYAEITVLPTAIPTYLKGILTINRTNSAELQCVRNFSVSQVNCVEKANRDAKIKVTLTPGQAVVSQETIRPGIDQALGTLTCK